MDFLLDQTWTCTRPPAPAEQAKASRSIRSSEPGLIHGDEPVSGITGGNCGGNEDGRGESLGILRLSGKWDYCLQSRAQGDGETRAPLNGVIRPLRSDSEWPSSCCRTLSGAESPSRTRSH